MILLFAGAGASKAVSPEKYPTTREFFDRLPEQIKNDPMFRLVWSWLSGRLGQDTVLDIEQFQWALAELRQFLERIKDPTCIEGWMLRDSRLIKPLNLTTDFSNLYNPAERLLKLLDDIIGRINERVYDWYSHEPSTEELDNTWLPLLGQLIGSTRLELFTTNYDLALETAAEILIENSPTLPRLQTGRVGKVKHYLDEQSWLRPPRGWNWSEPGGKLTKLHGSVDWTRGEDRIYVGDPTFKGSHKNQVILYPGVKGRPNGEPFLSFHNYFRDCLQYTHGAAFIGFAFRDEFINDLIERWLAPRARVIIVNPDETIRVPIDERRIERIVEPFQKEIACKIGTELGRYS